MSTKKIELSEIHQKRNINRYNVFMTSKSYGSYMVAVSQVRGTAKSLSRNWQTNPFTECSGYK